MISVIIVLIDLLIGLGTGLIIVLNGHEDMIWQAILQNDEEPHHIHIPQSTLLIMFLSTLFGVVSLFFFIVAKKVYKN